MAGVPVRCFPVDNAITDLLGLSNAGSPASKNERKRKQRHWESVQGQVVQVRGALGWPVAAAQTCRP